ncbi:MAG TPA: hypothetical protein VJB35_04960 [Candidatus Nanoarchaeia archaeon]|nr:hypothetical protein [Candidatus Nanoarchaeia archaeon]
MLKFFDSYAFDEFKEGIGEFTSGVPYCNYARRLNIEIRSGDNSHQVGNIICKKKFNSENISCALTELRYNEEGEIEANCSVLGDRIKLNSLEKI